MGVGARPEHDRAWNASGALPRVVDAREYEMTVCLDEDQKTGIGGGSKERLPSLQIRIHHLCFLQCPKQSPKPSFSRRECNTESRSQQSPCLPSVSMGWHRAKGTSWGCVGS